MQTNNELYQLALSKIKSNGLVLKNQSYAQKLRSIGYIENKVMELAVLNLER